MEFSPSARVVELRERIQKFIADRIAPVEADVLRACHAQGADWTRWTVPPVIEELKSAARAEGLWNLFLPDPKFGAGLDVVEYAPLSEEMGRSFLAPEVFNCNAPDTGNMEVLFHYGTDAQKERWLAPLLSGEIRSVFCMTEPGVASSDATNMQATIEERGDHVVLNGRKWWSTGLGHPRARVAIFMGVSSPENDRHHRHAMVLVPLDAPGVKIERMLDVFGAYDAPYGHGEVTFSNVSVPKENVIGALGAGFEIAQGRLGPGRIHHCMRAIGAAERALTLLIARGSSRTAFGKRLVDLGGNRERIAEVRIAIDQARLLVLYAAWKLSELGPLGAMKEISAIKVAAPRALELAVDEAIQMHGGLGLSSDVELTALYAMARALRLADGPDAVHRGLIARLELAAQAQGA